MKLVDAIQAKGTLLLVKYLLLWYRSQKIISIFVLLSELQYA